MLRAAGAAEGFQQPRALKWRLVHAFGAQAQQQEALMQPFSRLLMVIDGSQIETPVHPILGRSLSVWGIIGYGRSTSSNIAKSFNAVGSNTGTHFVSNQ